MLDPANFAPTHFRWRFADGVATVTLDRSERKNPLTFDSYAELRDMFRDLAATPAVKTVLLTGAGGNFCSGGDVHDIIGPLTRMDDSGLLQFTRMTGDLVRAMRACPQPIVAAVDGVCAGAGAILAMASDIRFGAPDARHHRVDFIGKGFNHRLFERGGAFGRGFDAHRRRIAAADGDAALVERGQKLRTQARKESDAAHEKQRRHPHCRQPVVERPAQALPAAEEVDDHVRTVVPPGGQLDRGEVGRVRGRGAELAQARELSLRHVEREHLGLHESEALEQVVVGAARRVERALEVVERGQQLAHDLRDAALLGEPLLAPRALAEVLEVRLRALREREELVALSRLGLQLVEVVLDVGGPVVRSGGGRGVGGRRFSRGALLDRLGVLSLVLH